MLVMAGSVKEDSYHIRLVIRYRTSNMDSPVHPGFVHLSDYPQLCLNLQAIHRILQNIPQFKTHVKSKITWKHIAW